MRISSKGQVTIPAKIRERAGLLPGTEVAFEFDGGGRGHRSGQRSEQRWPRRPSCRASARRGDAATSTDEITARLTPSADKRDGGADGRGRLLGSRRQRD